MTVKLLEISRKYIFWSLDLLKGGKIRRHFRDIMLVLNHAQSDNARERREQSLSAILHHAITTTPFYKKMIGYKSVYDFQVINKSIVRESFNSIISSKFKQSELISVVTSGSTGTPFKIYHDKNKRLRNSADVIFFTQLAGYDIGNRLIYLKIFVKEKMKNPISYWMENTIPIDVLRLNNKKIEDLIHLLEDDKSTYVIIGYSSALELICRYMENSEHGKVRANVKSVIAMSETLNNYTKETTAKYFNASVVARYSNLENGIIAQQEADGSNRYLINTASYFVEVLKMDSDEQSEPGQTGRIVVTDLFNYGMPLIRYDTGDIGALSEDPKMPGNMYLSKIEGRKLDQIYDTKGNLVSSFLIYKNMWQYTEIIQYQLIQQERKEYTIKINIDGVFNEKAKLINEFKTCLGEDAIITIEYVSEIPLLSSGKRKIIVNNYMQK